MMPQVYCLVTLASCSGFTNQLLIQIANWHSSHAMALPKSTLFHVQMICIAWLTCTTALWCSTAKSISFICKHTQLHFWFSKKIQKLSCKFDMQTFVLLKLNFWHKFISKMVPSHRWIFVSPAFCLGDKSTCTTQRWTFADLWIQSNLSSDRACTVPQSPSEQKFGTCKRRSPKNQKQWNCANHMKCHWWFSIGFVSILRALSESPIVWLAQFGNLESPRWSFCQACAEHICAQNPFVHCQSTWKCFSSSWVEVNLHQGWWNVMSLALLWCDVFVATSLTHHFPIPQSVKQMSIHQPLFAHKMPQWCTVPHKMSQKMTPAQKNTQWNNVNMILNCWRDGFDQSPHVTSTSIRHDDKSPYVTSTSIRHETSNCLPCLHYCEIWGCECGDWREGPEKPNLLLVQS